MSIWLLTLSDLLVNLSAGWFGAAIILRTTGKLPKEAKFLAVDSQCFIWYSPLLISVLFRKATGNSGYTALLIIAFLLSFAIFDCSKTRR